MTGVFLRERSRRYCKIMRFEEVRRASEVILDLADPVLEGRVVVVLGHGGSDAAARVVTAHDDVLDLRHAT